MEKIKLFSLLKESFHELFRNPLLFLPGFLLWVFAFFFSNLSVYINHRLNSNISLGVWLFVFSLVFVAALGVVLSMLLAMIEPVFSTKRKKNITQILRDNWFGNFVILLAILVFTILIGRVVHYVSLGVSHFFNLSVPLARTVFILLYFFGLVGFLIFFSYSNFYLSLFHLGIFDSIRKSFLTVKEHYLETLGLSVLFFILFYLVRFLPVVWGEIIEYVFVMPLALIILTKFAIYFESEKILKKKQ